MGMKRSSELKFTVRRHPAVLVSPAAPTPRELKRLSDVDDQDGLRFHVASIHFFRRRRSGGQHEDPTPVLRGAIAAALVHYYPLAGRLRELEGRKLAVDCTGEGVLFVEADADVCLKQFGAAPQPPFPCLDELLFHVPGSTDLLDAPLLHFQVTRLACGGFIMAVQVQHAVADGPGLVQFLVAVAELARGAAAPMVQPVWERELLLSSLDDDEPTLPRRRGFSHREYDDVPDITGAVMPFDDMVHRSFFFGTREVAAIRSRLPPALRQSATTFEILTGCLWRCRTVAMGAGDEEEMRMICTVSVRSRKKETGGPSVIPAGYYGNAFAFPVAISTAGDLRAKPVGYAVEKVRQAKGEVDVAYVHSVAALMARRGRPHFAVTGAYLVSDVSKAGFRDIDFGWGKPVYAGPAKGSVGTTPGFATFLIATKNVMGEEGILAPVCLPGPAMDKFVEEMRNLLTDTMEQPDNLLCKIKAAL